MAKRDHATRTRTRIISPDTPRKSKKKKRIRIIHACNKSNLIALRKIKPWAERDPCNNINPVIIF